MARTVAYFAYGSNMLTRRLRASDRAPSAEPRASGHVVGRCLTFDKVGQDGSGKCDAEATGGEEDRVHGVVFEISPAELAALDRAEGVGTGYTAATVRVVTLEGVVAAATYVALDKRPGLRPFGWYRDLVVAGAVEHGLPASYIERLRRTAAVPDPSDRRRRRNEELLRGGGGRA